MLDIPCSGRFIFRLQILPAGQSGDQFPESVDADLVACPDIKNTAPGFIYDGSQQIGIDHIPDIHKIPGLMAIEGLRQRQLALCPIARCASWQFLTLSFLVA